MAGGLTGRRAARIRDQRYGPRYNFGATYYDARDEATRRGDRVIGTEHLVLALLADPASPAAQALGCDLASARTALDALDSQALTAVGVRSGITAGPVTVRPSARLRPGGSEMSTTIDHVGIPAADPQASARFLASILAEGEVTPEGPDGEMACLGVGDCALMWFALAAHEPHHVAFKVTGTVLDGAISRLRQRGLPFGNDPGDPGNGRTDDPLGGAARIYFHHPDGHLFELFIPAGKSR